MIHDSKHKNIITPLVLGSCGGHTTTKATTSLAQFASIRSDVHDKTLVWHHATMNYIRKWEGEVLARYYSWTQSAAQSWIPVVCAWLTRQFERLQSICIEVNFMSVYKSIGYYLLTFGGVAVTTSMLHIWDDGITHLWQTVNWRSVALSKMR